METFMQQTTRLTIGALLSLMVACSPPPSKTAEEGSPNTEGNAPQGAMTASGTGTAGTSTARPKASATGTPTGSANQGNPTHTAEKGADKGLHDKVVRKTDNDADGDPNLQPAKELARKVAAAIIAKDVEQARKLFLPPALIEKVFPGDACVNERASGEKERQRMERKLPGILRRGARFLIHGPDNFDGKVEPADEAKVTLSLKDVTIRRSKTIPKGKTSKRGCTLEMTLVGTKVRLLLVATMDKKTADVPINIELVKVDNKDWYLAEL